MGNYRYQMTVLHIEADIVHKGEIRLRNCLKEYDKKTFSAKLIQD